MTRSPYWEPFARAVLDAARSAGTFGFTVDDVPLALETPPQVRGSVLGSMTFGGFIVSVGRERSRSPRRKGARVERYVLAEGDSSTGLFIGHLSQAARARSLDDFVPRGAGQL